MNEGDRLKHGVVVKAYGGYYYVLNGGTLWECTLRGRFRYEKQQVLVGDRVELEQTDAGKGVVVAVLPRSSILHRPPIANVDQVVIVFAVKNPEPNPGLLDRFLLSASLNLVEPLICLNKSDLANDAELELVETYGRIYRVLVTSARTGQGLDELKRHLRGRLSVFAGPSGVGKSTILNALIPGLTLKTGEISRKLKRGRHITRHVELISMPEGGLVADTPGFSSLDLPDLKPQELAGHFPEMDIYRGKCYFTGCLHDREPDCAVKQAVGSGQLNRERYLQYLIFLNELKSRRRY